jgi:hypothetical protein
MDFQISGLREEHFQHLNGADAGALAQHGVERVTVDAQPGYPCRVSLKDVDIGETVFLLNYEHLPHPSPFRSSHAIFVHEGSTQTFLEINRIPEMLRIRLLSVRAFDARGMMIDADIADGHHVEPVIDRMLSMESVDFLHLHNAKRGCFLARVDRAAGV